MLWLLRLLGAPSDPHENSEWQFRHPARVAFACALVLAGGSAALLLAMTLEVKDAVLFFGAFFVFAFVLGYIGARVNISRWRSQQLAPYVAIGPDRAGHRRGMRIVWLVVALPAAAWWLSKAASSSAIPSARVADCLVAVVLIVGFFGVMGSLRRGERAE
jgi:hypothetical protein